MLSVPLLLLKTGIDGSTNCYLENRAAKAIKLLSDYYYRFYSDSLSGKGGWFLENIYLEVVCISLLELLLVLLVIITITRDLYLPWSLSVALFKTHLTNKLMNKYKLTPNECIDFLYSHTNKYNKVLDDLFKELIDESPGKYIPIVLQRNPTLVRLSAQRLKVRR